MKRKIPLKLLKVITPYLNNGIVLVKPTQDDTVILNLLDNNKESKFYFKAILNQRGNYRIYFAPKSESSIQRYTAVFSSIESVIHRLKSWIELINEYNSIVTIYDDPIVTTYQKEYYSKLKFSDDKSDIEPYNFEQQKYLSEYLDKVIENSEEYKNDENEDAILEIQSDAAELKEKITKYSKNKVINKLSFIWAKAQQINLELIKKLFFELSVELTKRLLLGS